MPSRRKAEGDMQEGLFAHIGAPPAEPPKPRELATIAMEIAKDWKKPYFGAVPYINAMRSLGSIDDSHGYDSAVEIVDRFLCNATAWRGEVARRVKAELKAMRKGKSW